MPRVSGEGHRRLPSGHVRLLDEEPGRAAVLSEKDPGLAQVRWERATRCMWNAYEDVLAEWKGQGWRDR